ncbi:PspC domain-containing protein [Sphingomonas sp. HDW15A]|uniref:PspC domain-containing protein n=1 Tax=Sphingomonas sp. HDW15A TaxID=2714942 RepID=UPI00140903CD|nr:PspC domain-containing protein [Sphingomonas sp. HDW15A]QIK96128.1 PspC domain-containing protein [Sphingomonas sp. HDW15A]
MTATTKPTPLPLRNDTLLGVCEAIGQDFGINALWLRLAFIGPLFFQPVLTISVYLALGAVVAASRYFFPRQTVEADVIDMPAKPVAVEADEQLQIAA